MNSDSAREHLQVIRTLMERSALYRRALAPTTLAVGAIGVMGSIVGVALAPESAAGLAGFWTAVAVAALAAAFLTIRRESISDGEPFWSAPTRRVAMAMAPALIAGAAVTAAIGIGGSDFAFAAAFLPPAWIIFYGCALQAAGFFMVRGIRLFGGAFVMAGSVLLVISAAWPQSRLTLGQAHGLMGLCFGLGHLAYGAYLRLSERSRAT
jgi:hypothetical protein